MKMKEDKKIKIALSTLGGFGDTIILTMAARRLKELYPESEISGFSRPDTFSVLGSNPDFSFIGKRRSWCDFPIPISPEYSKFDVVIDFRYGVKSFYKEEIEFDIPLDEIRRRQREYELDLWVTDLEFQRMKNRMIVLEEMKKNDVLQLGDKMNWYSISSYFSGLNFDETYLRMYKQDTSRLNLPKDYIAISAPPILDSGFNRLSTKLWNHEKWNKLFSMFPDETFIALASTENANLKGENLINLGGKINIYESADVISKSKFLISIEGGLVHIAKAVKKKSIVLFGPTSKWFFGYPDNINIKADFDCFPCHNQSVFWGVKCNRLKNINEIYSLCMEAISVEMVSKEVEKLLNERN